MVSFDFEKPTPRKRAPSAVRSATKEDACFRVRRIADIEKQRTHSTVHGLHKADLVARRKNYLFGRRRLFAVMRTGRKCCTAMPVTLDPAQLQKGGVAAASCMGSSVSGFRDFLLKGKVFFKASIPSARCTAVCAHVADRTGFALQPSACCSRPHVNTTSSRVLNCFQTLYYVTFRLLTWLWLL